VEGVGHVGDDEHLKESVLFDVAGVDHLEEVVGRVGDELLDLEILVDLVVVQDLLDGVD
jgi:hypothetical protein